MYQFRPINPLRLEIQAQVIELRSNGWSFPTIAKQLDLSVGTAWNMANTTFSKGKSIEYKL